MLSVGVTIDGSTDAVVGCRSVHREVYWRSDHARRGGAVVGGLLIYKHDIAPATYEEPDWKGIRTALQLERLDRKIRIWKDLASPKIRVWALRCCPPQLGVASQRWRHAWDDPPPPQYQGGVWSSSLRDLAGPPRWLLPSQGLPSAVLLPTHPLSEPEYSYGRAEE